MNLIVVFFGFVVGVIILFGLLVVWLWCVLLGFCIVFNVGVVGVLFFLVWDVLSYVWELIDVVFM